MGEERTDAHRLYLRQNSLEARFVDEQMADEDTDSVLRAWLDGDD